MTKDKNFKKALDFVKQKHAGQMRAGESPTWLHLLRVAKILDNVLSTFNEGDEKNQIIVQASLGHDLLEDTNATKEEVLKIFGELGAELIEGMTNVKGDEDVVDYVKNMASSREEVRLIKLADLYDNISHVTYTLPLLGNDWAHKYFLPIVTPMHESIYKTKFIKYKNSTEFLTSAIQLAINLLQEELENYEKT